MGFGFGYTVQVGRPLTVHVLCTTLSGLPSAQPLIGKYDMESAELDDSPGSQSLETSQSGSTGNLEEVLATFCVKIRKSYF